MFTLRFTPPPIPGPDQTTPDSKRARKYGLFWKVSDGDRTRDRRNHNPELYQLSYAHHGRPAV